MQTFLIVYKNVKTLPGVRAYFRYGYKYNIFTKPAN